MLLFKYLMVLLITVSAMSVARASVPTIKAYGISRSIPKHSVITPFRSTAEQVHSVVAPTPLPDIRADVCLNKKENYFIYASGKIREVSVTIYDYRYLERYYCCGLYLKEKI